MKKFSIATKVNSPLQVVWKKFDRNLLEQLRPLFPKTRILHFDEKFVSLELDFVLFKQQWVSLITERLEEIDKCYFVDKGVQVPFFLKHWHHKHLLLSTESGTLIVDEITYEARRAWLDGIIYPLLYLQFWMRKPIYRRYFQQV
ncbi:MAG: hypothetical protein NZ521_02050 [Flammeovirgaceae bacterium]|nr:hypothetical protein [Flammeovirgaceae bacterium]MDW8286633.1 hypothetical protein [Flammeovirgaceae bacterium]